MSSPGDDESIGDTSVHWFLLSKTRWQPARGHAPSVRAEDQAQHHRLEYRTPLGRSIQVRADCLSSIPISSFRFAIINIITTIKIKLQWHGFECRIKSNNSLKLDVSKRLLFTDLDWIIGIKQVLSVFIDSTQTFLAQVDWLIKPNVEKVYPWNSEAPSCRHGLNGLQFWDITAATYVHLLYAFPV